MTVRSLFAVSSLVFVSLGTASETLALANRVFVSARSGNNANSCDNVNTPCLTLTGALAQLNPNGEAIVVDSGGYGAVTITQGVTIEAAPGITAFIHPSSGMAITINAGASSVVTLRGLVLSVGTSVGIYGQSVGTLNVENCIITGFDTGILMGQGKLGVKNTDVKNCASHGIRIGTTSGTMNAFIDHCHLDGNTIAGLEVESFSSAIVAATVTNTTANNCGAGIATYAFDTGHSSVSMDHCHLDNNGLGLYSANSTVTATNSTANRNIAVGWVNGNGTSGTAVLSLEFCSGSENGQYGFICGSGPALTHYSNCVFASNGIYGVNNAGGTVQSRGNNSITGNGSAPTSGTIGTFPPM